MAYDIGLSSSGKMTGIASTGDFAALPGGMKVNIYIGEKIGSLGRQALVKGACRPFLMEERMDGYEPTIQDLDGKYGSQGAHARAVHERKDC
jgi:hypothetical protein